MRINRYGYRPATRLRYRQAGCMTLIIVMGIMTGVIVVAWSWGGKPFNLPGNTERDTLTSAAKALERGQLDAAIETARRLWLDDPENVKALTLLVRGLVYRSYDDYNHVIDRDTALRYTTEAFEATPENPDVLTIHAFALHANGAAVEAARLARIVLAQQPDDMLARVTLGMAYSDVGGHQNALRENQQTVTAIAEGEHNLEMDANRALALSLGDVGRYEDALVAVDDAIAANDRLAMLYFERALYAMQLGDADAATTAYFRILAFDADNIKARLRLCALSSILRETENALLYCQQVTEEAPGWVEGWYHLGREYYLRGDFAEAQKSLARCTTLSVVQGIPIEERELECWYFQGQSAEIRGDCAGLLAVYEEFQTMVRTADLPQTWVYPPEGPAICTAN